jgi:hypothetical protein
MTDLEFGIGNAGMKVWPSSSWSLCYFHVHMNNSEKMDALQIPKKIQGVIQNQIVFYLMKKKETVKIFFFTSHSMLQ